MAGRLGLALIVAVSLGAPLAGAVPWMQEGFDPARTGSTLDAGPADQDVAFEVALPGFTLVDEPPVVPLVLGGYVFAIVSDPDTPTSRIVRVTLSTGEARLFAETRDHVGTVGQVPLRAALSWLASDGTRLLAGNGYAMHAWDLREGNEVWSVDLPKLAATDPALAGCVPAIAYDGKVVTSCWQAGDGVYDYRAYVVALDATTGDTRWLWVRDGATESWETIEAPGVCAVPGSPTCSTGPSFPQGIAAGFSQLFATFTSYGPRGGIEAAIYAISDSGQTINRFQPLVDPSDPAISPQSRGCRFEGQEASSECLSQEWPTLAPVVAPEGVYFRAGNTVRLLDPALDGELSSFPFRRDTRNVCCPRDTAFATSQGRLYAAADLSLHSIEGTVESEGWPVSPIASSEYWTGPLVVAGGETLYATTVAEDYSDTLYAFDSRTGDARWKVVFTKQPRPGVNLLGSSYTENLQQGIAFAVGDGVLPIVHRDGRLIVLGKTDASLDARATVETEYPAVGEEVEADLSTTIPGAFGPATSYASEWGDGSTTDWQTSPVLTHAYNASGDFTARLIARNDANQTASITQVFHVGASEPTFLSTAFAAENQNLTFFFLGLTGTAVGGAFGLTRLTARRHRLAREMRLIDEVFANTRTRARDCEAALAERKAHCRGLLLDGKLEEAQFQVVEKHVEQLSAQLRLGTLDARFKYLPWGMVEQLRDMLQDGRVTGWEREHFLSAIERDRTMSDEQKANVRALVDEWFERDSGGG